MPIERITQQFIICDDRPEVASSIRYIASGRSLEQLTKEQLLAIGKKYNLVNFMQGTTKQLELLMPNDDLAYSHDDHNNQYIAVANTIPKTDPNYQRIHIFISTEVKGKKISKTIVDISRNLLAQHKKILEELEQYLIRI